MFVTRKLGLIPYANAYSLQLDIHARVAEGSELPTLLLLEHPRVITHGRTDLVGTNRLVSNKFLESAGIDIVQTERGGTVTYHGPGQLVAYAIFPVRRHVRDFLRRLERVQIRLLERFDVIAQPNPGYAGVFVGDDKIGSIGVAIRRNVALHGLAINISTQLSDFDFIVPCGLVGTRMTSLEKVLERAVSMLEAQDLLEQAFIEEFKDYDW